MDTRRCKACWECIEVCPEQLLGKMDVTWHLHAIIRKAEACIGCKQCVRACESAAIEYIYVPKTRAARSLAQRPAVENGLQAYNKLK